MPVSKDKIARFRVKETTELTAFLTLKMSDVSRSAIKKLLTNGHISVNDKPVSQHNHLLHENDSVVINYSRRHVAFSHPKMSIIFEDDDVVVIDKSEGLLSVTVGKENEVTAFDILLDYLTKKDRKATLFVVHRIDRDTSGVMMFAKTRDFQQEIQRHWYESVLERKYVALVEGAVSEKEGRIMSYLSEHPKSLKMHSSPYNNGGQQAVTDYKLLSAGSAYSLLEISLETGRKNQIRVHMQDFGHSIAGDKKYGASTNPIGRMGLHAYVLAYRHPFTGESHRFEVPIPKSFLALVAPAK